MHTFSSFRTGTACYGHSSHIHSTQFEGEGSGYKWKTQITLLEQHFFKATNLLEIITRYEQSGKYSRKCEKGENQMN